MTIKTHARDYLLELANRVNTSGWMCDLIVRIVNSNGQFTEEDLSATTEQLKTNGAGTLPMPTAMVTDSTIEVRLTELIHHSGVNALASEQKIPFSKDITLLYGQNGTGKSSYFRILNEIIGGNREIPIHHNIFSPTTIPINVDLNYTKNGTPGNLHWNGTGRAIAPLTLASVFDSGYTSDLLEKRSADTAIVRPLGLHLFTAMTQAMDTIKSRLSTEMDNLRCELPRIDQDNLTTEVRSLLNQQTYSIDQKRAIECRYTMPEEKQQELDSCQKQYNDLNATNYDDKIKLTQGEKNLVDGMRNHLQTCANKLREFEQTTIKLFVNLKAARTSLEEARQKIKILGEIGNTDSAEWRAFIQQGEAFKVKANFPNNICPYCRQPLQGDAVKIVQAYAAFLDDQKTATYNNLLREKEQLQAQIDQVIINNPDYSVEKLANVDSLKEKTAEIGGYEGLKTYVTSCQEQFEDKKKRLLSSFETEDYQPKESPKGTGTLMAIVAKYDTALEELKTMKASKDEQMKSIREKLVVLLEHKAIAEQKNLFADWFAKMHKVRELGKYQGELSTRTISSLSKTASNQLLTEGLKEKFQEELNALKLGYLKVSLDEEGARSGQSFMKIKLPANYRTQEILSEGEQKGVALALFIAERRMEQVKNPIILDDPVNSLDHHITARLVERLVELGNQIIIFSHHILLRDSLLALSTVHECGKTQFAGCQKQSKHLFVYNVSAREAKGFICESRQDNAKHYIQRAQRVLGDSNFDETTDISICAGLLRQAIEHLVDEKVFKNLVPVKYRGGKNQTIIWDKLKQLQADPALIDMMHNYYSRLSGGDQHLCRESQENQLDWTELNTMAAALLAVV